MLLLLVSGAFAVSVPGDYASVAAACNAGETAIEVSAGSDAGGSCYISGGKHVTITGSGTRPVVPVVFQIYDDSSLELENLSFEPSGEQLFQVYNSELTLSQVSIAAPSSSTAVLNMNGGILAGTQVNLSGGGVSTLLQIYSSDQRAAEVHFSDSSFKDAQVGLFYSTGFGAKAVEMSFEACEFSSNHSSSTDGGVLRVENADDGDLFRFDSSTIKNNSGVDGGAIYVEGARLELEAVQFENNTANGKGGAVYSDGGQLDVRDSSFISNAGNGYGGAIYISEPSDGKLTLIDSWLCSNMSPNGSGVYGVDATPDLDHVALVSHGGGPALDGLQVPLKADHMSLIANDVGIGIGDAMSIENSLAWANEDLAEGAGSVAGGYNAYGEGEQSSSTDIEIDDPGFDGDPTGCAHPPWLKEGSVLLGAAGDGTFIGAYGLGSGGSTGDSDPPDSEPWEPGDSSSLDSLPGDTGPSVQAPITWVSGGSGGEVPAALLVAGGLLILGRRRW